MHIGRIPQTVITAVGGTETGLSTQMTPLGAQRRAEQNVHKEQRSVEAETRTKLLALSCSSSVLFAKGHQQVLNVDHYFNGSPMQTSNFILGCFFYFA